MPIQPFYFKALDLGIGCTIPFFALIFTYFCFRKVEISERPSAEDVPEKAFKIKNRIIRSLRVLSTFTLVISIVPPILRQHATEYAPLAFCLVCSFATGCNILTLWLYFDANKCHAVPVLAVLLFHFAVGIVSPSLYAVTHHAYLIYLAPAFLATLYSYTAWFFFSKWMTPLKQKKSTELEKLIRWYKKIWIWYMICAVITVVATIFNIISFVTLVAVGTQSAFSVIVVYKDVRAWIDSRLKGDDKSISRMEMGLSDQDFTGNTPFPSTRSSEDSNWPKAQARIPTQGPEGFTTIYIDPKLTYLLLTDKGQNAIHLLDQLSCDYRCEILLQILHSQLQFTDFQDRDRLQLKNAWFKNCPPDLSLNKLYEYATSFVEFHIHKIQFSPEARDALNKVGFHIPPIDTSEDLESGFHIASDLLCLMLDEETRTIRAPGSTEHKFATLVTILPVNLCPEDFKGTDKLQLLKEWFSRQIYSIRNGKELIDYAGFFVQSMRLFDIRLTP